jgi:hypothetical protein
MLNLVAQGDLSTPALVAGLKIELQPGMPDVGAQSMLGGFAVARKLALPNGTGACFDWAVSDPILPGMGEDSPEGLYNAVFIVMQVHPFHPTLLLLLPARPAAPLRSSAPNTPAGCAGDGVCACRLAEGSGAAGYDGAAARPHPGRAPPCTPRGRGRRQAVPPLSRHVAPTVVADTSSLKPSRCRSHGACRVLPGCLKPAAGNHLRN